MLYSKRRRTTICALAAVFFNSPALASSVRGSRKELCDNGAISTNLSPELWPLDVLVEESVLAERILTHAAPLELHLVDFRPRCARLTSADAFRGMGGGGAARRPGILAREMMMIGATHSCHLTLVCKKPFRYPSVFGLVSEYIAKDLLLDPPGGSELVLPPQDGLLQYGAASNGCAAEAKSHRGMLDVAEVCAAVLTASCISRLGAFLSVCATPRRSLAGDVGEPFSLSGTRCRRASTLRTKASLSSLSLSLSSFCARLSFSPASSLVPSVVRWSSSSAGGAFAWFLCFLSFSHPMRTHHHRHCLRRPVVVVVAVVVVVVVVVVVCVHGAAARTRTKMGLKHQNAPATTTTTTTTKKSTSKNERRSDTKKT